MLTSGDSNGVGTMANNPWVAIDPTTSPSLRANELRQIGHDYLGAGRAARVWQSIAESWRLSKVAGIDLSSSQAGQPGLTLANQSVHAGLVRRQTAINAAAHASLRTTFAEHRPRSGRR